VTQDELAELRARQAARKQDDAQYVARPALLDPTPTAEQDVDALLDDNDSLRALVRELVRSRDRAPFANTQDYITDADLWRRARETVNGC